jgi:hypothetical protein
LIHDSAEVIRAAFRGNQEPFLEKAQGLTRRNQGGVAAEPVAYLIVRKLGH